ncbi:MAG: 1-acyl-sn-glycerol-3-phosphate acyltransferase [Clostridiales bacterium]|jgi:1-acyl-sn-glycerol-3-phosphate acyltransferase|nr:1-acyl-sn-glycerol-3-phosphate acyltransferase [Clostridiales bacterium]
MPRLRYGQTLYYHDERNDDFVNLDEKLRKPVETHRYEYKGPLMRFLSWCLYYLVAVPGIKLMGKIGYGVKFKGRQHKKGIKGGFMVYSNHVHFLEFLFTFVSFIFPRRAYIVCNPDPFNMFCVRHLAKMLGGLPLPGKNLSSQRAFVDVIDKKLKRGGAVMMMPEAHIWPYYTGVRPFSHRSFVYAVKSRVPIIPAVTTFRAPKGPFKRWLKPRITIIYGAPVYPKDNVSVDENARYMRDEVYAAMQKSLESAENCAFYQYVKADAPVETRSQIRDLKASTRRRYRYR